MDFSNLIQGFLFKLSHGLVKIDERISLICSMDLSKLQHGFVTVVTVFVKVVLCISFFALKVINESKYSLP